VRTRHAHIGDEAVDGKVWDIIHDHYTRNRDKKFYGMVELY